MTEIYCPSVDVCAWCGDSECDGIGCIAMLEPENPDHCSAIGELHATIRAGKIMRQAMGVLAELDGLATYKDRYDADA